jgi:hypothetical protein
MGISMSLVDQLKQLVKPQEQEQESKQLKDLEEVVATLKEIGVTLEPKFDISLAARIGAVSTKR